MQARSRIEGFHCQPVMNRKVMPHVCRPQIDGLTPRRWAGEGGPLQAPGPCTRDQLRMALGR